MGRRSSKFGAEENGRCPRKRHNEEQIAAALQQVESGVNVAEVCRKAGSSEEMFYTWKKQYARLGISQLRELRQMREENGRLTRLVADMSLDPQILREFVSKTL